MYNYENCNNSIKIVNQTMYFYLEIYKIMEFAYYTLTHKSSLVVNNQTYSGWTAKTTSYGLSWKTKDPLNCLKNSNMIKYTCHIWRDKIGKKIFYKNNQVCNTHVMFGATKKMLKSSTKNVAYTFHVWRAEV